MLKLPGAAAAEDVLNICMIGAGYVGLVSAVCFSEFGWTVTCVDKDARKIDALRQGVMPIFEPGLEDLLLTDYDGTLERLFAARRDLIVRAMQPALEMRSADLISSRCNSGMP